MKIRYIGSDDPSEHTKTTAFGQTFLQGEWTEVSGAAEALATNPMFEADGGKVGRKPKAEAATEE